MTSTATARTPITSLTPYRIVNTTSGLDLGIFLAEDEQGALDALARDAGYASAAEAAEQYPGNYNDDLKATVAYFEITLDESDPDNPGWRYDRGPHESGQLEDLVGPDLEFPAALVDGRERREFRTAREAILALAVGEAGAYFDDCADDATDAERFFACADARNAGTDGDYQPHERKLFRLAASIASAASERRV